MPNASRVGMFHGGVGTFAGAGTALATGTALTAGICNVTTAAGETAVVLPAAYTPGVPIVVVNGSATAALLFPGTSAQKINNGSAGASFSVAQNKPVVCHFDGTNWIAVLSA
jgi:hypothetical protein